MAPSAAPSLESQIQSLLEFLLELGVCTSDVQPTALEQSQNTAANGESTVQQHQEAPGGLVGQKVQATVDSYLSLFQTCSQRTRAGEEELLIPNEVIEYIDQGRNPDLYTRELVERVAGENQYTNGIISAVSSYRDLLAREMKIAFPEMKAGIEQLEAESTAGTGNSLQQEAMTRPAVKVEQ